jgi:4-amino-4-deoxy-L-arabinose transferase-like glycosyltransferase
MDATAATDPVQGTSEAAPGRWDLPGEARWVALLMGLAAAVHLVHAAVAARDPYLEFRVGDELYYDGWARQIAGGALLGEGPFFSTPLFAYVLAGLYRLGLDGVPAVLAMNAALGLAAVAFTWSAARRLAGPVAALWAGALVAFARPVLVYEGAPEKTTLVLALCAAAFAAATWAAAAPTWRRALLAGAVTGLAALGHALALLLVPAVLVHLAVNGGLRRALRPGAAYVAGALLAVSPATVHNAVTGGELILVCSNGGHNLYLGNHLGNATGLYTSPPFSTPNMVEEERSFRQEAERRAGRPLRPGEVSAFWSRQALREMAAVPGLTVERFLRKLRWAVNQEEITDTRSYGFYAGRLPTVRWLLWDFGLPSVLAILGAAVLWRRRWAALPLAFATLYAVALGVFFVYGRYRLPLLVPAAILGGGLLAGARGLLSERRPAVWAARGAAVVVVTAVVFGRVLPGTPESFFPDYFNQGRHALAAGRTEAALAEFEKAITVKPGDHPALVTVARELARMHLSRGDPAAALRVLQEAAQVRPGDPALAADLARLGARGR